MDNLTSIWRPPQRLRAKAVGIIRRGDRILVTATTQDDGTITGWRPPGGGIEFGERAAEALVREIAEELKAEAKVLDHLGVLENHFVHHGERGHEIVFVFEAALVTPGITGPDRFVVEDSGFRDLAAWISVGTFHSGEGRLWPEGLIDMI